MSNEIRRFVNRAENLLDEYKVQRIGIFNEGRKDFWNKRELEKLKEEYSKKLKQTFEQMEEVTEKETDNLREMSEIIRKHPAIDKPKDESETNILYHVTRAGSAFKNLSPEKAAKKYSEIVSRLKKTNDINLKYIYSDMLQDSISTDKKGKLVLNNAINENKTDSELIADRAYTMRQTMNTHNQTLKGLISQDFEALTKGEKRAHNSYSNLYDEFQENAGNPYVNSKTDDSSLKDMLANNSK